MPDNVKAAEAPRQDVTIADGRTDGRVTMQRVVC
jgi:hypothetical protein